MPLHYRHITAVLDSASPLWLQAEVHALVLRCVEGLLHGLELSLPQLLQAPLHYRYITVTLPLHYELSLPQLLQAPAPTPPCRHD